MGYVKYKGRLPNKLSALLAVGLRDIEKAEKMPDTVIDMRAWMANETPDYNHHSAGPKCIVCFAGSVMMNTLHVKKPREGDETSPSRLPAPIRQKLYALNAVQDDNLHGAFDSLGIDIAGVPDRLLNRKITPYHYSPSKFKDCIRRCIVALRKHGL